MDHLSTLDFCFQFFFMFLNLILAERRRKTKKEHVDHLLTSKRAKCGPLIDPTAKIYNICVYVYIYTHMFMCMYMYICIHVKRRTEQK